MYIYHPKCFFTKDIKHLPLTPDYQVSATTMSKSPQVTTVHEKKKKKSEIASGYFSAPLSFK